MKTRLHLPAIAGQVHLGCSAEERKKAQAVQLALIIDFSKPPKALESDSIDDTPCYAEMTKVILEVLRQKHYATIEHLCWCCHHALKSYLKKRKFKNSKLTTTVQKMAPPVLEIVGGSHFTLQEKV